MKDIYLTVVIPCYNEERNIRLGALENVASYLSKQKYTWEVIIIDDGSTDESIKLIKHFITDHQGFRVDQKKHMGKAGAVTAGILNGRGEIIIFTDLDQATPISELGKLLPLFAKGSDIVIGSRSNKRKGAPLLRRTMAMGFMILRNLILNLGISDTQCGFKAFKSQAALKIFPLLKVFNQGRLAHGSTVTAGFDVEVLYLAKKFGFKIAEVPVEWHYQETRHVNPLSDSLESIIDLVTIRLYSAQGKYNT